MPTVQQLKRALAIQSQIESLHEELASLLGAGFTSSPAKKKRGRPPGTGRADAAPKKRRKLSPEALEKIRAGQQKRWAKFHKEQKAAK